MCAATAHVTFAMDEQRMAAPPQAPATSAVPSASVQSQSGVSADEGGTEIRIPGLGKLGTLPKMDFGLDLLYGASENRVDKEATPDADNLMIRGSVKHRF